MKLDLFTNAMVVDDAIRFASQKSKSKEELNLSANDNEYDKEESNESDYDEKRSVRRRAGRGNWRNDNY